MYLGGTAVNKKLVVGDQVWIESREADTFRGDHCIFTGNIIHVDFWTFLFILPQQYMLMKIGYGFCKHWKRHSFVRILNNSKVP